MVTFIRTLSDNWPWLALLFLLIAVWFIRRAVLSRRDWRYSIFGLEREQGKRRTLTSLRRALWMVVFAAAIYLVSDRLVPLLPQPEDRTQDARAQAVPTITVTPTITPRPVLPLSSVATEEGTPTATATPTGTPTPDTVPTPAPTPAPAVPSNSGCGNPGIQISSPAPGASVSGSVSISGTANIEGFQFYKVEIAQGETPAAWSVINDIRREPVSGGLLDTWNTAPFPTGTYWLRLVVVDQTGNYPSPCAVRVVLNK